MSIFKKCIASALLVLALPSLAAESLTLSRAVALALADDPLLLAYQQEARGLEQAATAQGALPDPQVQIGLINLPGDSFEFDQEPMTQLKVGVTQMFPAGDSRALREDQGLLRARQAEIMGDDYRRRLIRNVRNTWLELRYWEQSKQLLLESEKEFYRLLSVVRSLYEVGRKNQQDLVRAELELSRLQGRLLEVEAQIGSYREQLAQWLGQSAYLNLSSALPDWEGREETLQSRSAEEWLVQHPALLVAEQQLAVQRLDSSLAEQAYKPRWGVNLSYGYREGEDQSGVERPDFVSATVMLDIPLYAGRKQGAQVRASREREGVARYQRDDKLRSLRAEWAAELSRARQLRRSLDLYRNTILSQAKRQAELTLSAYRADASTFDEVMRASIAKLEARIGILRTDTDYFLSLNRLFYYQPLDLDSGELNHE